MNPTVLCAVIDDEPLARGLIKSYIEKTPGLKCLAEFESAAEASTRVIAGEFDLLLLDIDMPQMTGMEFGGIVGESTRIIYVTAYPQYALEGFRVNALDYLLKPVSYPEFLKAAAKAIEWKMMRRALREVQQENGRLHMSDSPERFSSITVKSEYRLLQLRLETILYAEVKGDRVIFHRHEGDEVSTLMTMRELEEILPADRFMRIHRSYIVNLDRVEVVERSRVVFGNTYIPISDGNRDEFLRRLSHR